MSSGSDEIGIVGYGDKPLRAEDGVVLADKYPRTESGNCFADVIVVAVDVNGKDAKFFVKAALGKESVHVFLRDEGGFSGEIVSPIVIGALEALDFFRRTIE